MMLTVCAIFAQLMVRPWSQTNEPLEARVARDFEKTPHAEAFVHYAVPPMSDVQRLKDVYPYDGKAGGTVKIIMAKDEYEPGSFLVWGLKDLGKTHFTLSEFKNEKKAGHGHEGLITHWTDEAVGDPVFYAERVKPLVDQFDAVAERVNADMTAADIKDIAENWLQQLVDFPYIVNRLRGEWLRERL